MTPRSWSPSIRWPSTNPADGRCWRPGVLELGAALAATRWVPAGTVPRSFLFLTATVVAALFAGLTVRSGSEYMGWLAERAERLEIERDQQKAIGAAIERTRIAREIHDIVAHSLSVVITLADAASVTNASDPARATETMRQASEVGRQALGDMRTVLNVLRTEEPDGRSRSPTGHRPARPPLRPGTGHGLGVEVAVEGEPFALGAAAGAHRVPDPPGSAHQYHQARLSHRRLGWCCATGVRVVELTVTDNGTRHGHRPAGAATGSQG